MAEFAKRPRRTTQAPHAPVDGGAIAIAVDEAVTRRRLLDAAGAVFAEVGYERAHVREICSRARANVAAIKYHFGGKFQLYEAAIGYWFERQQRLHPAVLPKTGNSKDGDAQLRAFVAMFVGRLLDRDKPAWHAKLMAREMVEPTGVLDTMVAQSIRPTLQLLRKVITGIVGPDCPKVELERSMLSVVSQCLFYLHCRPVLERVFPAHINNPDLEAIVSHITEFSAAGLRAICKRHSISKKNGGDA